MTRFALALTASLVASPLQAGPYLPIAGDNGGQVIRYVQNVLYADKRGQTIAILGGCYSACTLYLRAKRVCLGRGARLAFHAAQDDRRPGRVWSKGTSVLRSLYPAWVRSWIDRSGALRSLQFTYMPRKIALQHLEACRS